jgi:hypothetical protein
MCSENIQMLQRSEHDPVFWDADTCAYGFFDESWAFDHGPFKTEEEARAELDRYCREELGV